MKVGDLVTRIPEWGSWTKHNPWMLTEKDLEVEETKDDSYKFRSILEATPSGLVIMKYDVDQEAWNYWADKKNNITFDELETVCRRYCLTYGCAFLYKDRKLDIENQKKELDLMGGNLLIKR